MRALVVALNPVVVALAAWFVGQERMTPTKLAGIAIALAGCLMVIGNGDPLALLHGAVGLGEWLIVGCVLCWTAYTFIGRSATKTLSPLAATLACALLALLWERLLRRFGGGRPVSLATVRPAWLEWFIGLVLPAWRAAEEGAGGRAFAGVIGPLALLMLPFASRLAVFPPAAMTVRWQGLGWASVFAIALLVAVRAWRERRRTR